MGSGGAEEPPGNTQRGTGTTTVFRIFGDESCTNSGAYRVQGALWVRQDAMTAVRDELARVRAYRTGGGPAEIKWSRIRGKRLRPRVKALVDVFFTSSVAASMHFNAIIVSHADDPTVPAQALAELRQLH
jgi:hypothetical protein